MPPRPIRPGLHHVTFTCVRRLFLLWPSTRLKKVIRYVVALTAERYGLLIHELIVLSNHIHLAFTDRLGNRPEAMAFLSALLARQINALLGQSGSVFETYHCSTKLDDAAVLNTMTYVLANPVQDELVERVAQWPGLSTRELEYGEKIVVRRPAVGLWNETAERSTRRLSGRKDAAGRAEHRRKSSTLPDTVTFELVRPECHAELSDEELRAEIRARVLAKEESLIEERRREGRHVLGLERLRAKSPRQASHAAPSTTRQLFTAIPRYAGSPALVAAQLALDRAWVKRYLAIRSRYLAGERDIAWPEHTWLMRRRFAAACEGPRPLWPPLDQPPCQL